MNNENPKNSTGDDSRTLVTDNCKIIKTLSENTFDLKYPLMMLSR